VSVKLETEVKQLEERLGKINYVEGTSERLANDQRQLRFDLFNDTGTELHDFPVVNSRLGCGLITVSNPASLLYRRLADLHHPCDQCCGSVMFIPDPHKELKLFI
jgi:hypothetical protein